MANFLTDRWASQWSTIDRPFRDILDPWERSLLQGSESEAVAAISLESSAGATAITGLYSHPSYNYIRPQTTTAGTQYNGVGAGLSGGGYVIVWEDNQPQAGDLSQNAIRGQAYDANGAKIGAEFLANTATLNMQTDPAVVGLTGGGFVVVWQDQSGQGGDTSGGSIKAQLFSAAGVKVGSEFLVNTTTLNYQGMPEVAATANGGFAVTWMGADANQSGVFAQFFTSTGAKSGSELAINSTTTGAQTNPAVTILANGNLVVTWEDNSLTGGDASGYSIKGRIFSSAGVALTGEFLVNTITTLDQKNSTVTALTGGGFVVTWEDSSGLGGDSTPTSIKAQIYDASGAKVGGEFLVNTTTNSWEGFASVTAISTGGFAVAYLSYATAYVQVFDGSGGKVGTEFRTNAHEASNPGPSIAALTEGRLLVVGSVQNASWDVAAQIYVPDPGPTDAYVQARYDYITGQNYVFENEVENAGLGYVYAAGAVNSRFSYQIVTDSTGGAFGIVDGKMVVLDSSKLDAENASTATIVVRVTDDAGRSYEESFTIDVLDVANEYRYSIESGAQVNTSTLPFAPPAGSSALQNGGYVVVWGGTDASGSGVKGQLYDPTGTKVGAEFDVNTTTAGTQDDPKVAGLTNGEFVVVWADAANSWDVKGQRFAADGTKIGGEFLVPPSVTGTQHDPDVVALSNGNFVVTYTVNGTGSTSVYGQLFGPTGAKIGTEFLVGLGGKSDVIALDNGGFVVGYTHYSGSWQAKFQRFDAAGAKLGGETIIGQSSEVAMTVLENGSFIALTSGGSEGLVAHRYASNGSKLGTSEVIPEEDSSYAAAFWISGLQSGGYVVGWSDGSATAVQARVFTADGTPQTAAFMFKGTGSFEGFASNSIVSLGGSDFVAVYASGNALAQSIIRLESSPPSAVADLLSGLEDTPATFSAAHLLGNDSDPDGGTLTLVSVTSGVGGTAVLNEDGTVTFTPAANFSGNATFTYRLSDGNATASGIATVTVQAANDAPTNSVPAAQSGTEDTPIVFSVSSGNAISVADADGGMLTVTVSVASGTLTLAQTSGLTFVSGANGSSAMTFSGTAAAINAALDGLSYVGNLNYEGADTLTLVTSDGTLSDTDTVAITLADDGKINGGAGNDVATGADGGDFFDLRQGGDDTANGLGGNDGFYFGAAFTSGDTVNGGDGTDQLAIQGDYSGGALLDKVTGVETISLLSGSDTRFGDTANNFYDYQLVFADSLVAAGQNLTVNMNGLQAGEDATIDASAETDGSFTFFGGAGTEDLTGGGRNDGFYFGAGLFGAGDVVDGGGGTDNQLGLRGNYSIDFRSAGFTGALTNIQTIAALTGSGQAQSYGYSIVLSDAEVGAGQTLTITGATLTATEALNVNGVHENDGALRLIGGAGNDWLLGGQGADIIFGGLGADNLEGSGGGDRFVFTNVAQSTTAARDTIHNFVHGTDLIDLGGIDANTFAAGNQAFTLIGTDAFAGTGESSAGQLRVFTLNGTTWRVEGDVDGDGVADFALFVNEWQTQPLTAADFVL